jgi:hypothetical protein
LLQLAGCWQAVELQTAAAVAAKADDTVALTNKINEIFLYIYKPSLKKIIIF